jgi:HAD superfamily hydrolase (TIGR01549 family)
MLDVDGTLVDSNAVHAEAWVDVFRASGREVPFDRVLRLIGMGGDKLMPAAVGLEKDSPEGKHLSEERKKLFMQRLPRLQATPGAPDLIKFLEQAGYRLAVASSAEPEELESLLRVVGAEHLAQRAATSEEAGGSKPEPDIVQVALEKLGTSANESVLLGDTPYDIEAAQRAGVAAIAFECGGWRAEDLKGAVAVYRDPADLLARWQDSPLATRPRASDQC